MGDDPSRGPGRAIVGHHGGFGRIAVGLDTVLTSIKEQYLVGLDLVWIPKTIQTSSKAIQTNHSSPCRVTVASQSGLRNKVIPRKPK